MSGLRSTAICLLIGVLAGMTPTFALATGTSTDGVEQAFATSSDADDAGPDPTELGRPGYLVIEASRDSLGGFTWRNGPRPGYRSLVWADGLLSLPDSVAVDPFGRADLGVGCTADLAGVGASGNLKLRDGIYEVSEPVLLTDGVLELHVSGGELEIRGAQIRYRSGADLTSGETDERRELANYMFLAGLIILVVVLMRRARHMARAWSRR